MTLWCGALQLMETTQSSQRLSYFKGMVLGIPLRFLLNGFGKAVFPLKLDFSSGKSALMDSLLNIDLIEVSKDEISKVFISWWHIWFAKNKVVFSEESLVPSRVVVSTIQFFKNWRHAQGLEDCLSITPRTNISM